MPDTFISLQAAADTGLTLRKLQILEALRQSSGTISSLSSKTRHVRQLVSNDLNSLAAAGLVEENPERTYRLTPQGVELLTTITNGSPEA